MGFGRDRVFQRRWLTGAALAASLLILFTLIILADPRKLWAIVVASDVRMLAIALLISTANLALRTLKWSVLVPAVPFRQLVPIQLLGIAVSNLSPGKVAEPAKAVMLKLTHGIPVSAALPSVLWERLLEIIALLLLAAIGLMVLPLSGTVLLVSMIAFGLFVGIIVVLLLVLQNKQFRSRMLGLIRHLPGTGRISDQFVATFEQNQMGSSRLLASFGFSLAAWVVEGFIIYFALAAVGIQISPLVLACIFALATIIGVATVLPGGIGSTDAIMALFLGLHGIDAGTAIAGVLLARLVSIWYVTFLGGVSLLTLSRRTKDSRADIRRYKGSAPRPSF